MKKNILKFLILSATILFVALLPISQSNTAFAEQNDPQQVYIGGTPIGIIAEADGLVVTDFINITSLEGSFSPALHAGMHKGDIILAVNDQKIREISQLNEIITNSDEKVIITVFRDEDKIDYTVEPIIDLVTNSKKIGLMVKNNIAGIGTMTFIKPDGAFGALGHRILDGFGHDALYQNGFIYSCTITGYKKASPDIPGELIGKINNDVPSIGVMEKNTFYGIFGKMNNNTDYSNKRMIKTAQKNEIKPGKATIYTTIEGETPKEYSIEIVKTLSQSEPAEKGMVIRVTDKNLLSTAGGILQGMSGSPIIQNGKLVGAVTHVFTNDTTMGYGMYIDWMLQE